MAITVTYTPPTIFGSGQLDEPEILALANNGTILTGDIVGTVANAGQYTTIADNPAATNSVAAIALHDSAAVYFNANSGQPLAKTGLFGSTQTGTSLQPNWDASQTHGGLLRNNQMVSINSTDVWATTLLAGTASTGIQKSGSNFTSNTAKNKCATIVGTVDGPNSVFGTVGDTNKRILITFLPAACQI